MIFDRELKGCAFAKTILMILIVLYHSLAFFGGSWFNVFEATVSLPLKIAAGYLNTFHIYAFTLISGYIFYYLKFEARRYDNYGKFALNKAKRLLIPYLFVCAVWVIPFYVLFYGFDISVIVTKYVLAESPSQLWFLVMLFLVFILFYPLSTFFKEKHLLGAVTVIAFYGLSVVGNYFTKNYFQIFSALSYTTFFYIGFKLRQFGLEKLKKIPLPVWLAASILLYVATLVIPESNTIFKILLKGIGYVTHIVSSVAAFLTLQLLSSKINWADNKIFNFFTGLTMPIYLFHQQVIYVIIALLNPLIKSPYLLAPVLFIGSLTVSALLGLLFTKVRPLRLLVGEK